MANIKISGMPVGAALDGTELVPIVQSAGTFSTTAQGIKDYVVEAARTSGAFNVSTRMISSRNANIYADGAEGKLDPNGISGWNFQNSYQGEKINWYYVYNQNPSNEMTLTTLTSMYAVVRIYNEREFHFSVYTSRENDGADYSWYRSRVNYELTTAFDGLSGQTVLVYFGEEPKSFPELARVELPYDVTFSNGPQGANETVLFAALSTDSNAGADEYNFTVQNLGHINKMKESNEICAIGRDFDLVDAEIGDLKSFKNAVEIGRFFRGYVNDEAAMVALPNPLRFEYVARIDTETIWEYDGVSDWYDTLITMSLQGIAQEEELVLQYTDKGYVELDGLNDYINLTNANVDIMDYTKTWNIGLLLSGNVDTVNDSSYITLFKRGTNEVTLRKGGSNWGIYVYADGLSVAQANTWHAPQAGSRILVVCTGTKFKYYLDGVLRANMTLNGNVSSQDPAGDLQIGKGGIKGSNWTGGVDNIMLMEGGSADFGKDQLYEYHSQNNVSNMSFYPSVSDFLPLGELPFPNCLGLKQNVEGTIEDAIDSSIIVRDPEGGEGTPFAQAPGRYAFLDGTNNYVEFDNANADVLDYTKQWAFSMSLKSVSGMNDAGTTVLFSRGKNDITLVRGGSNWGIYCFANGVSVCQANTWYAPASDSRIVVVCTGTRIEYYLNGVRRANMSINANVSNQDPSGNLKMGDSGFVSYGLNWYGGVENSFLMHGPNALLTSAEVNEFVMGVTPSTLSYYDQLDDFFQYGLETYPSINGVKGSVTGNLIGGTPEDFVNI